MSIKSGVKLTDLWPQLVLAYVVVQEVCRSFGIPCVVTSANDSRHSTASWHYKGRALDFRTKFPELDGREQEFRNTVKEALGDEFDVVMEAVGTDNEHLHVEYDPK